LGPFEEKKQFEKIPTNEVIVQEENKKSKKAEAAFVGQADIKKKNNKFPGDEVLIKEYDRRTKVTLN